MDNVHNLVVIYDKDNIRLGAIDASVLSVTFHIRQLFSKGVMTSERLSHAYGNSGLQLPEITEYKGVSVMALSTFFGLMNRGKLDIIIGERQALYGFFTVTEKTVTKFEVN